MISQLMVLRKPRGSFTFVGQKTREVKTIKYRKRYNRVQTECHKKKITEFP